MGRAFPELDLVTLTLHGIGITPLAIADEHGNSVVIDAVDATWAERLARPAATVFGGIAALCGYPLTAAQVREAGVLGTLSLSERIGGALRGAREAKSDPVASVLTATGGHGLFRGKIIDVQRRTQHGWTRGEAVIEGFGAAGGSLTVAFQNENLVATLDTGEVLATVPDLIAIVDAETGHAITTERLRYGFRVVVLGIPCAAQWRTPAGVALAGPRHFRYELEYVPLEELVARRAAVDAGLAPQVGG
jgi:uncharacterized protein